jgi:hypothetical protein
VNILLGGKNKNIRSLFEEIEKDWEILREEEIQSMADRFIFEQRLVNELALTIDQIKDSLERMRLRDNKPNDLKTKREPRIGF